MQVFFRYNNAETGEQSYEYVGDYASIHALNENNSEHFGFDRLFAKVAGFAPTPSVVLSVDGSGYSKTEVGETSVDVSARASAIDNAAESKDEVTTITDADGKVWTRHFDEHGAKYWYCRATRESSWVEPQVGLGEGGVWIPMISPKGKQYYYNRCVLEPFSYTLNLILI